MRYFFFFTILSLVFITFIGAKNVSAGCTWGRNGSPLCVSCANGTERDWCRAQGNIAREGAYCIGGNPFGSCNYGESVCDTPAEAKAICGNGGTPYCPGSCDNSTCWINGGSNCSDFSNHDQCLGINPAWPSSCKWNDSGGYCYQRYCHDEYTPYGRPNTCGYLNGEQSGLCQAIGCNFTPNRNNCDANSTCTNGLCSDPCGNSTVCGGAYTPIYPIGGITIPNLGPTFLWTADFNNQNYANLCIGLDSSCNGLDCSYPMFGQQSLKLPLTLTPNTHYYWLIYGAWNPGTLNIRGSGCQNFWTPTSVNTCTVSLSTATPTISVGQTALVTANVTTVPAGTTINSIAWTSSNPAVGTIFSPTVTGIVSNNVTGVSAGTTNISATVNLSPSGSCSTTTSLPVTVYPRSWWQVTGGDVYVGGGNVVSSIPSTCTQNCYINLAN